MNNYNPHYKAHPTAAIAAKVIEHQLNKNRPSWYEEALKRYRSSKSETWKNPAEQQSVPFLRDL